MQSLLALVFLSLLLCGVIAQNDFAIYTLTQGTPNQVTVLAGNATGEVKEVNKVTTGGNGVPPGMFFSLSPPLCTIFIYLFIYLFILKVHQGA
jgi:hypothetical protein